MREMIIGIAVACFAAAGIVTATALGLPFPNSAVNLPCVIPAAAPPAPTAPRPEAAADDTRTPPPAPILSPAAETASEEDALLLLARKSELAGDLKTAKALYLRLSHKGNYRDLAAQRLGDFHFAAGEYRQAEELYRESARLLREGSVPAQKPLPP